MSLPHFENVLQSYQSVEPILKKYLSKEEIDGFGDVLREKSTSMQPRVMVYGVYNAGKSTLLNALMGKEDAPVSDRPETSTVTTYPWNGYALLDTPGIDAPVADEITARNEINRSDAVLFVVATGGAVDEAKTWDELVSIIQRDRKVMLVLNNKQGLDPNSEAYQRVADKFRNNLQYAAEKAGIKDVKFPPISLVNAKSALKGRLENKPALVEHSGIIKLEQTLSVFLKSCDASLVFNTLRSDLIRKIDCAELVLDAKAGNQDTEELTRHGQLIDKERISLTSILNDELEHLLLAVVRRMVRAAEEYANNPNQMESEIQQEAERINHDLGRFIDEALQNTNHTLKEINQKLSEAKLVSARVRHPDLDFTAENASDQKVSVIEQATKAGANKVSVNPELVKDGTVFVLKQGKGFFPTLFKGIGPKTMEKWAGTVGKVAGPFIAISVMTYDLVKAQQKENEERKALVRRHQAIQEAVNDIVGELRSGYRDNIRHLVANIFNPLESWVKEEEQANRSLSEMTKQEKLQLAQIKTGLQKGVCD